VSSSSILAALGAGATSPETIVARVYRGLSEPLVAMARESVLAHLMKLQREQRVRPHEDGTWELTI
jgi:hypothetical protein